jgi:hypothetical protein
VILSEIRAQGWKFGCIGALAGLLGVSAWGGIQSYRLVVAKGATAILAAKYAEAERDAVQAARAEEQAMASVVDAVAKAYERGKVDAKAAGDRVAAGLRAGNVRLREQWRGCEARLPGTAPDPGELADAADWRAGSAGRIVGATARDAAQIRCLQAIALTDRGIDPGDLSKGCPEVAP